MLFVNKILFILYVKNFFFEKEILRLSKFELYVFDL